MSALADAASECRIRGNSPKRALALLMAHDVPAAHSEPCPCRRDLPVARLDDVSSRRQAQAQIDHAQIDAGRRPREARRHDGAK